MVRSSRQRSMGEMISSVAFASFGIWLFFEARKQTDLLPDWRIWGLYICSFFCILAAFRFVISENLKKIKNKK